MRSRRAVLAALALAAAALALALIFGGKDSKRAKASVAAPARPADGLDSSRPATAPARTRTRSWSRSTSRTSTGAGPLRRPARARPGPPPLQPQPRPRLRRPGQAAARDQQPARQGQAEGELLRLPGIRRPQRRPRRSGSAPPAATRRRPGRRSTTTTCSPASTAWSSPSPRTTARRPRTTTSPPSRSCRGPATKPEALPEGQGPERQGRRQLPLRAPRRPSQSARAAGDSITSLCIVSDDAHFIAVCWGSCAPTACSCWGSLVFAWAAMGMTVLIPWLVGRAVNAIQDGNQPDLLPLALAIVGASILRLGLTVVRRLVAGRVSLGVEFDLRQTFYRAPAAARARLLRRPADRPADVAGDGRPAVDPLLPRLRPDLHHPEPADDHPRRRGDDRDQPAAGADRADPRPVRHLHRLALQPRLAAGAAGGAAADRRADRGSRGERLRDPHRQGLRPRGTPAAPLPARGRPGLRPEHLLDPPAGDLLAADRPAAPARDRPDPAGRRPHGDRRQAQPRQLHRLLHLPGDAGRADADARRRDGDGAAGDRLRQPACSRSSTANRRSRARPGRRRCRPAAARWRCAVPR